MLVSHLPLMRYVITARLMLFVFLFAGLMLALFLDGLRAVSPTRRATGIALAALALLPLLPRLDFPGSPAPPAFFTSAAV